MIKNFINRPVLSTVISIMIVILGILGLKALPVTQYPDIAPATVQVSANYAGANAETVMKSVVIPIEEQINGVEGMDYIQSSAGNDGSASITVYFKQGVNADIASVNVQNQVARATPLLPSEVVRSGVITKKQNSSALMYLTFFSKNKSLDDVWLQNYLNINIIPSLRRVNGVGDANVFGGKTYAMRIWLNPAKMASYGLSPSDITTAINSQSREAAAGQIGSNSGSSFEYTITYQGKFSNEGQYDDIILKALGNGQFLRLKDVAKVKLDALSYSSIGRSSGYPSISMGIFQTPGSNAQDIINNIKLYLGDAKKTFPNGVDYVINFDTNDFLNASIEKVLSTLLEAFILVFIVVFIFLQDFRSTLIPAISVPVSIIGTFFFLNLFGYSLNLLTLFALVLAIGIVVDDAIVVVEAVHAKLDNGISNAKVATVTAMDEITGAIISITLVMAAVFIPVTFIKGPTGVFYQQFGITLIIAILISAVNALTLSPVLCALFLKPNDHSKAYKDKNIAQKFFYKFNVGFTTATAKYGRGFIFLLRHKWVTLIIFGVAGGLFWWANSTMPAGFVPKEDRGIIFTDVQLPPGASMERTYSVLAELQKKLVKVPGVKAMTISTGRGFLSGNGSNYGLAFLKLGDFKERAKHSDQSVENITKNLFIAASSISDAKIVFFQPGSVPGYGSSSGFTFVLLDKFGGELKDLDNITQKFIGALTKRPEIQFAQSSFNTKFPQFTLVINVPRAQESGVSVDDILSTMQGYVGGVYAADFTKYGKQFRVIVQGLPDIRNSIESLSSISVKTSSGAMAPLSQFVTFEKSFGPQSVSRYNLYTSVAITGSNSTAYSSGDAIKAVQEVAAQTLPSNYSIDFTGLSREEINSKSQTSIIFILSIIFVYFILAAQYESYLLPLTILISLPLGVFGAYMGQSVFGLENNIYFQIALIMLVGLLAKNAILIVEFAIQRRAHGESISLAAINAAKARLRPILMTSFAFFFGMMPLVFATGIGSVGNRSIGTGAAFGLLVGTFLGLFVVPVLFVIFQTLQEKIKPLKEKKLNLDE